MNAEDMRRRGLATDQQVCVRSSAGTMHDVRVRPFDIKAGNAAMYFPEANILVPANDRPRLENACVQVGAHHARAGAAPTHQLARTEFRKQEPPPSRSTSRDPENDDKEASQDRVWPQIAVLLAGLTVLVSAAAWLVLRHRKTRDARSSEAPGRTIERDQVDHVRPAVSARGTIRGRPLHRLAGLRGLSSGRERAAFAVRPRGDLATGRPASRSRAGSTAQHKPIRRSPASPGATSTRRMSCTSRARRRARSSNGSPITPSARATTR